MLSLPLSLAMPSLADALFHFNDDACKDKVPYSRH